MNQIIEFKKDCITKTYIDEITEITLSHDYKILDDVIEGYFDVSGSYKMSKSSVQEEDFMFTIPFTIALSNLIDRSSINLKIHDFKYSIEKDIIHLNMYLDMNYEEVTKDVEEENNIEEIIDNISLNYNESINETPTNEVKNLNVEENEIMIENNEIKEETTNEINSILNTFTSDKQFCNYKIYIMRSEDTIESIAIKYNVSLNDLKNYNNIDKINVGDKIIIPIIKVDE